MGLEVGGGRGFGVRDKVGMGVVISQPHRIRDRVWNL